MKKRFVTIITIFVLLFCFYSFSVSNADTLGDQQQQIKEQKEQAEQKLEYVKEELSSRLV